jgi:hypothetical protein
MRRHALRAVPREATNVGAEFRGASEAELKGVEVCRDRERGVGGDNDVKQKFLRNGVHRANGVVWGAVCGI